MGGIKLPVSCEYCKSENTNVIKETLYGCEDCKRAFFYDSNNIFEELFYKDCEMIDACILEHPKVFINLLINTQGNEYTPLEQAMADYITYGNFLRKGNKDKLRGKMLYEYAHAIKSLEEYINQKGLEK